MSSKFVKAQYAVPQAQLPAIEHSEHIDQMHQLRQWMKDVGVNVKNTRIDRYIRYFEQLNLTTGESGTGIFNDPPVHPFASALDRYLYVLREVHELMWIYNGFRPNPPKGIEKRLAEIVSGSDFAALDRDSTSRNTQFELRIASYFCRNNYSVDVSTETDVVAISANETFFCRVQAAVEPKAGGSAQEGSEQSAPGQAPPK